MPLPAHGFDPTETGVPCKILKALGHRITIATPEGKPASADPIMVTGKGLGPLRAVLRANAQGRAAYHALTQSAEFQTPISYNAIKPADYDALLLPGGHAKGMRPYLESPVLQNVVTAFFAADKPVGAICHGTLLVARSKAADGKSVLFGRITTSLTRAQELLAWGMTRAWMKDYYRTYSTPLETEIRTLLASPADFIPGPSSVKRDGPDRLKRGFTVLDGKYLSARWPGDAHRFANEFAALLR